MTKVTVSFTLDSERDRRLVQWLDRQENKSAAIRKALEFHLGGAGLTLGDVYQAVMDLERRIGRGGVVLVSDPAQTEEPPDVALVLDNLGL